MSILAVSILVVIFSGLASSQGCGNLADVAAANPSLVAHGWNVSQIQDCCSWPYITCISGNVVQINFTSNSLTGSLIDISVDSLQSIAFRGTNFGPAIPNIGKGPRIYVVNTSFTQLPGSLPGNLNYLEIRGNNFLTGNLLQLSVTRCVSLQFFWVENNPELREDISSVNLGGCTALAEFYYTGNNINGTLNSLSLGGLSNLRQFYMAKNRLSGSLPPLPNFIEGVGFADNPMLSVNITAVLVKYPLLVEVWLSRTNIIGTIPDRSPSSLKVLAVQNTGLGGTIPPALTELSLTKLYLSGNRQLSAPQPLKFPPSLVELGLKGLPNVHIPEIFSKLSRCLELKYLFLGDSPGLTGTIPSNISALVQLVELYADNSGFSGPLPASLSTLTSLKVLWLCNNSFSGPLPDSYSSLSSLRDVCLGYNNFSGAIPSSWDDLGQLATFDMSSTGVTGPLPFSWASRLTTLYINNNNLTGCPGPFLRARERCSALGNSWDAGCDPEFICGRVTPPAASAPSAAAPAAPSTSCSGSTCQVICAEGSGSQCATSGSVSISNNATLVIPPSTNVIINGNLTLPTGSRIQIVLAGNQSSVSVQQCLSLGSQSIDVQIQSNSNISALNNTVLLDWSVSCSSVGTVGLSSNLDVCAAGAEATVQQSQVASRGQLSLVFIPINTATGRCGSAPGSASTGDGLLLPMPAVIGISIAAAVLAIIIVLALVFGIKKLRHKAMPFRARTDGSL